MTQPDYPLPVLPSYEMYQLAHIATFLADGLVRHRAATTRAERAVAMRDIEGGRVAMTRAMGSQSWMSLPAPIDAATFQTARGLVNPGPRWAHVVSLAPLGEVGWAVVGHVPGVGPVGARMRSRAVADAVAHHVMTQPSAELAPWAVTDKPYAVPPTSGRVDLAEFARGLDPSQDRNRAVARRLRGLHPRVDAAIDGQFAGIDLDAPLVVRPPAPQPGPAASPAEPAPGAAAAGPRSYGPPAPHVQRSGPSAPASSAGP